MALSLLMWIIASFPLSISAQNNPYSKDMEKMMKEMKGLDKEMLEMMRQMGIELPDMKILQEGLANDPNMKFYGKTVPDKDPARISIAGSKQLNAGNLKEYITQVHQAVSQKAGIENTSDANEMFALAKQESGGLLNTAQLANGLWIFGANLPAILVLGKTLTEQHDNDDNLNNYAAFLTMTGAEEAALPILLYLNRKYPKNSTILNNIGQAWFGLGELTRALAYLDSTTMLFPGHSQANFTKSLIEEKQGKKEQAIESMKKSLETSYSYAKEKRLQDLGFKLKSNHIPWHAPIPSDALGFGNMNWPPYPKSVEESVALKDDWEAYNRDLSAKSEILSEKMNRALSEMMDPEKRKPYSKFYMKMPARRMHFSEKAMARFRDDIGKSESKISEAQELLNNTEALQAKLYEVEQIYGREIQNLHQNHVRLIGEGSSSADHERWCQMETEIKNRFLREYNNLLEEHHTRLTNAWKMEMSKWLNYQQYTRLPHEFEFDVLHAKVTWLAFLLNQQVKFVEPGMLCEKKDSPPSKLKKLPDFDDVSCNDYSTLNLVIGTITTGCNRMITTLDIKYAKFTVKQNMNDGTIIRGTVEVGGSIGIGESIPLGPVAKTGVKGTLGGFVEFDNEGITDIGIKAGVKSVGGTNVIPKVVEDEFGAGNISGTIGGVEARWGWNSGGSLEGKGILSGIKF